MKRYWYVQAIEERCEDGKPGAISFRHVGVSGIDEEDAYRLGQLAFEIEDGEKPSDFGLVNDYVFEAV